MDKKKEHDSLPATRFAPGENQYRNDKLDTDVSSFILSEENQPNNEEADQEEGYQFLYWQ
ncbi:hypothetical protein DFP93_13115 [Aneurinibacillus soli]|uniref:Uncharacterized protein n=1 Tax=Aneurinibacillus soli TaxID=1500254 RepID=A0A0U5BET5_9BACL|nr:hypothetical protein [Aneurinibacillus soli]PYE57378.1 hypothetical protein DFP93_13115 [Aneurinibacillus soli]BAU28775.1 hypothetical protein CB4_02952 [Aneurinibacillus soli]